MEKFILTIFLLTAFLPGFAHSQSIYAIGYECIEPANQNITTPGKNSLKSQFTVIEQIEEGLYLLEFTGGLPRFTHTSNDICIDTHMSLGHKGVVSEDDYSLPELSKSLTAIGKFDGKNLIVVFNSIYSDLKGFADFTVNNVMSSGFLPISYTLFLEFDTTTFSINVFTLKKIIRNTGLIVNGAASIPRNIYHESILPSLAGFNILEPPTPITYFFDE